MSATLPARLGEPSRALIVARRLGRPREALPVVIGTLVSQTLLNVVALVILGIVMFSTVGLFAGREQALLWYAAAPFVVLVLVLVAPALVRSGLPKRSARVARWMRQARAGATRVRRGLIVFRRPRLGSAAVTMQLGAWALQLVSCYVLMVALGLDTQGADLGAAAAVLFAVNVSAVLPLTPSNLGVFQAACVLVLNRAYGIGYADALALRDHPAGRRGRDGRRARDAGAGEGGRVVARGPAAGAAHRSRRAVGGAATPDRAVAGAGVAGLVCRVAPAWCVALTAALRGSAVGCALPRKRRLRERVAR